MSDAGAAKGLSLTLGATWPCECGLRVRRALEAPLWPNEPSHSRPRGLQPCPHLPSDRLHRQQVRFVPAGSCHQPRCQRHLLPASPARLAGPCATPPTSCAPSSRLVGALEDGGWVGMWDVALAGKATHAACCALPCCTCTCLLMWPTPLTLQAPSPPTPPPPAGCAHAPPALRVATRLTRAARHARCGE